MSIVYDHKSVKCCILDCPKKRNNDWVSERMLTDHNPMAKHCYPFFKFSIDKDLVILDLN